MKITAIEGEPARFSVESQSQLQCCACHHCFGWPKIRGAAAGHERRPVESCACPKCRQPVEPVRHMVDVESFMGNGSCSCQAFEFKMLPEVSRGWNQKPLHCNHLIAAFYLYGQMKAAQAKEKPHGP